MVFGRSRLAIPCAAAILVAALATGCATENTAPPEAGLDNGSPPDSYKYKQDTGHHDQALVDLPVTCTPSSCSGCCQGTSCVEGISKQQCGAGGKPCQVCKDDEQCVQGACKKNVCDPGTCPKGCCDPGGVCQNGTTNAACGTGGVKCSVCKSGQACVASKCDSSSSKTLYKVILVSAQLGVKGIAACFVATGPLEVACDPYVTVIVAKTTKTSTIKQNNNNPTWNETMLIAADKDLLGSMSVSLSDSDPGPDTPICSATHVLTTADLAKGTLSLSCMMTSLQMGVVKLMFAKSSP